MILKKNIVIYGYGVLGKIVEKFLQNEGIQPSVIIDNYKCDHATVSFNEFLEKRGKENKSYDDVVIISISDRTVTEKCIQELKRENISYGIIINTEEVLQRKKITYDDILWSNKDANLIELYRKLEIIQNGTKGRFNENYWAHIYHDTIRESSWLIDKAISPGRWAVGYNFLYVLYRVLSDSMPKKILELGLGQSTKLTMQYAEKFNAEHLVVEHDDTWKRWFLNTLKFKHDATRVAILPLMERKKDMSGKYFEYQGFKEEVSFIKKVDVVLIDGPFGGDGVLSRRDILTVIPEILNDDFIIILDDCGRMGEKILVQDIQQKLEDVDIHTYMGVYRGDSDKDVCVIVSEDNKFFASM